MPTGSARKRWKCREWANAVLLRAAAIVGSGDLKRNQRMMVWILEPPMDRKAKAR